MYQVEVQSSECEALRIENEFRTLLPANPTAILTDKTLLYFYLQLRSNEAQNALPITSKIRQEVKDVYLLQPTQNITPLQNSASYINLLYRDYIYSINYVFLSDILSNKNLDNQSRSGTISTAGAVAQQLY